MMKGGVILPINKLSEGEIEEENRKLKILQRHARLCQDGSTVGGKAWKKKLSEALCVKQPTISKIIRTGFRYDKMSPTRKALVDLSDKDLEQILGVSARSGLANQSDVPLMLSDISDEQYASIAKDCGLLLSKEGERLVSKYEIQKRWAELRWRGDGAPCTKVPVGKDHDKFWPVPVHESEYKAISGIFSELTEAPERNQGVPALVIHAAPHSGISHLLYRLLPRQERFREFYPAGIFHLYLDMLKQLETAGREVAMTMLGMTDFADQPKKMRWAEFIADKLVKTGGLLIIHGASSAINAKNARLRQFISSLADEIENKTKTGGGVQKRCTRLLLTAWDLNHFRELNGKKVKTIEFRPELKSGQEALCYLNDCIEFYRRLRAQVTEKTDLFARPGNNIFKRVQHHYSEVMTTGLTLLPSSVRFRAFCMSDVYSPSPFDPTQGIRNRLDNQLRNNAPEITFTLGDVQTYIRALQPSGKELDLQAIRLGSTALFFLTNSMLKELGKRVGLKVSLDQIQILQNTAANEFLYVRKNAHGHEEVVLPLLMRTLIQDDWIHFDPDDRCRIHLAIGDILEELARSNDRTSMERELPYLPPWGNGQIVFALESIRHYMRASQVSDVEKAQETVKKALVVYDTYLERGMFSQTRDKNLEHSLGFLARAYGMHSLKYEALCLLSQDGYGKKPPLGIEEKDKSRFYQEIGITLTHLLRPGEALDFFNLAVEKMTEGSVEWAYALSHRITAALEAGKVREARNDLIKCQRMVKKFEASSSERESINMRNQARKAAIRFAQGKVSAVEPILEGIAAEGLTKFTGDRSILYIDTHLPPLPSKGVNLEVLGFILMTLEQARNDALKNGFEHERIRLDIRRARIYWLLCIPQAAEPVLERVGIELHCFGGSEMVFREFQAISSVTLCDLGRPSYAFSAYAWPAFVALDQKNVPIRRDEVRRICIHLLDNFNEDEQLPNLKENYFQKAIKECKDDTDHPAYSFDLLPPANEIENCFEKLQTEEGRKEFLKALR